MILAPRPRFRASGRPQGPRLSAVPAGISHDGFPGFWDYWVLGFLGSPSRSQGNSARGSGQGVPGKGFRARGSGQGVPGKGFRARGSGQGVPGKGFSGQGVPGKGFRARGSGQGVPGKGNSSGQGGSGQGVPAEAFLRAGFRCPYPSWNPSEALPCEAPGRPPGGQTSPGPVSTAICTKDNLRQYVAPLSSTDTCDGRTCIKGIHPQHY